MPDERPDDADLLEHLVALQFDQNAFADFWALKWADLLRVEEKVLDEKGVKGFHGWILQLSQRRRRR